ncbi:MAG TPA: DUF481 domain-containing protein [Chitinophagaceae bacterium]|nr:DUF481 domain-containing protein [Chitinophagaceae bacterium]
MSLSQVAGYRLQVAAVIILSFFIYVGANAQIINVENSRIHTDTVGWAGELGAQVSFTKNTQEVFLAQMNAHLQYKTQKDLFLILGNYGFLSGDAVKLINNSFLHLRYNRKLSELLRIEAFSQILQNPVTLIDYRFLTGAGPRFKLSGSKKLKLYAATLVMYEYERELDSIKTIHNDIRSSSYASFSIMFNSQTELVNTIFYQPLFTSISDFRILDQMKFSVKTGKKFSVSLNLNYLYDNVPAPGVPRINYTFSTGLDYKF